MSLPLPLECCICDIRVSGIETLISHINGKQHGAKAYRQLHNDGRTNWPVLKCLVCNIMADNVDQLLLHLQSASHITNSGGDIALSGESAVPDSGRLWTCDLCHVTISGTLDNEHQHITGKQHLVALARTLIKPATISTNVGLTVNSISDHTLPSICNVISRPTVPPIPSAGDIGVPIPSVSTLPVVASSSANDISKMNMNISGQQQATRLHLLQLDKNLTPEPIGCSVCNITVTSKDNLKAHYMGKQHRQKLYSTHSASVTSNVSATAANMATPAKVGTVPPVSTYYCEVCNVSTNSSDSLRAHKAGKSHAKKLKVAMLHSGALQPATSTSTMLEAIATKEPPAFSVISSSSQSEATTSMITLTSNKYHCELCQVTFMSDEEIKDHYQSRLHVIKSKVWRTLITSLNNADNSDTTNSQLTAANLTNSTSACIPSVSRPSTGKCEQDAEARIDSLTAASPLATAEHRNTHKCEDNSDSEEENGDVNGCNNNFMMRSLPLPANMSVDDDDEGVDDVVQELFEECVFGKLVSYPEEQQDDVATAIKTYRRMRKQLLHDDCFIIQKYIMESEELEKRMAEVSQEVRESSEVCGQIIAEFIQLVTSKRNTQIQPNDND